MFKTTIFLMLCGLGTFAQKNLTLRKNQSAQIRTTVDELTIDKLVMEDSSMLSFGGRKNMYLQINHLVVGRGCILAGRGKNGRNGDDVPATASSNSRPQVIRGNYGWTGANGTNLFITIKDLIIQDTLIIFVPGGNGGNGTSAPYLNVFSMRSGVSTPTYNAGNPYNGLPDFGGNGGRGGNVTIAYSSSIAGNLGRIVVMNYGGMAGQMGDINPEKLIPQPMSVLDPQARLNDPMYIRKPRQDGKSGNVKLVKLAE